MSNKELYRRSFDNLRPSEKLEKELTKMMNEKKSAPTVRIKKLVALVAAVAVVLSLAVAASATEILQTVHVWINGVEAEEEGVYQYGENGDIAFDVDVEDAGSGRVDVIYTEGEIDPDMDIIDLTADITAAYENRDGKDFLILTDGETGEVQELDITEKIVAGKYEDTLTAFGRTCEIALVVDGETYSLNFAVTGGENE